MCLQPSDVDHLSDDEILNLKKNAPRLNPLNPHGPIFSDSILKLTPNTVAKRSQDRDDDIVDAAEANALDLVFAETTIPVPRVRRVVVENLTPWIIMDYISGPTLARIWPTLSTWRKVCVAFRLRSYIRQLRRFEASATTPPGPLSAQGPRICESPVFGAIQSWRGPFASYSELSIFFNKRHKMTADFHHRLPQDDSSRRELFDDSKPLVLTHQDLSLRNIIVGEDSRLWIIDWAWAGFYPLWFEYVAMTRQNRMERLSGTDDWLWQAFIPFICGPHFKQEKWLDRMAASLNWV
ncbi:hypothetical protein C0989_003871 [Termitomyces sp. Mn162]|nr:hypothetical protein C0989_003871 [Termitomyces sp. Mn162]